MATPPTLRRAPPRSKIFPPPPDPEAFIEPSIRSSRGLYSTRPRRNPNPSRVKSLTVDTVSYKNRQARTPRVASWVGVLPASASSPARDARLCRGACLLACRPIRQTADHQVAPANRPVPRRSAPSCMIGWHQGRRPQLAVLRPSAFRATTSSKLGRVRRHEGEGRADAPLARVFAVKASRNPT